MANQEMRIGIGETKYIGDTKITVSRAKPRDGRRKPSGTCYHEAAHAVVGKVEGHRVKKVSVKPGPGYKGVTELSGFSAAAAMAAKADGHDGTGWDEFITERQGHNPKREAGKAKAILDANREAVEEVAYDLAEKETLDDSQVDQAMNRVGDVVFDIERHGVKLRTRAKLGKKEPTAIIRNEWIDVKNNHTPEQPIQKRRGVVHAPAQRSNQPLQFPGADRRQGMRKAA